jgi:hypothetical protein
VVTDIQRQPAGEPGVLRQDGEAAFRLPTPFSVLDGERRQQALLVRDDREQGGTAEPVVDRPELRQVLLKKVEHGFVAVCRIEAP